MLPPVGFPATVFEDCALYKATRLLFIKLGRENVIQHPFFQPAINIRPGKCPNVETQILYAYGIKDIVQFLHAEMFQLILQPCPVYFFPMLFREKGPV